MIHDLWAMSGISGQNQRELNLQAEPGQNSLFSGATTLWVRIQSESTATCRFGCFEARATSTPLRYTLFAVRLAAQIDVRSGWTRLQLRRNIRALAHS